MLLSVSKVTIVIENYMVAHFWHQARVCTDFMVYSVSHQSTPLDHQQCGARI